MSRRDRIRARLIHRAWGLNTQLRWIPPYGWITKAAALGLQWGMGAEALRLYPYQRGALVYMGFDPGNPNGDATAYAVHDGDKLTFVDFSEIEQRILAIMSQTDGWPSVDPKQSNSPKTGRYRK